MTSLLKTCCETYVPEYPITKARLVKAAQPWIYEWYEKYPESIPWYYYEIILGVADMENKNTPPKKYIRRRKADSIPAHLCKRIGYVCKEYGLTNPEVSLACDTQRQRVYKYVLGESSAPKSFAVGAIAVLTAKHGADCPGIEEVRRIAGIYEEAA